MATVGIFFGSDTGNTENIAKMIQKILQKQFGDDVSEVHDIAKSSKEDGRVRYPAAGYPDRYYGEAQCDWDDFFPTLEEVDFNGKLVALFGCGDREDYAEYFCDAMGTIRDIIEPRGAAIVGHWPTKGYHFEASKGPADDNHFIGLAIDEDRQPELTNERVDARVKQIVEELSPPISSAKPRRWRKVEQRPCKVHSVPTGPSSAAGIAAIEATDL